MRCVSIISGLVLFVPLALAAPTHSSPVVTMDVAFIDNRSSNDPFGHAGINLNLDVGVRDSPGVGLMVSVVSSNSSFPFTQPVKVTTNPYIVPANALVQFTKMLPLSSDQLPSVKGNYTFTITNSNWESVKTTSSNLDNPAVIQLPTGLTFSNHTTTPVFSFTDPNPTPCARTLVRRYRMEIFDADTLARIYNSRDNQQRPSFTVPDGILKAGWKYYFRALILDIDRSHTSGTTHSRWQNRAIEYAPFEPAPLSPGSGQRLQ